MAAQPSVLGGVGSTGTGRTEGLRGSCRNTRGSCRNTRALGNTEASLECGICPLLNGPFGNYATEPSGGTISPPPYSTFFPSVRSGEAEVWHLQPKILKFRGYWVYPGKSNPENSEPWQSKLKDNKEPQPCPITKPKGTQG